MIPIPLIMAVSVMGGSIGAAIAAGLFFKVRHEKIGKQF